MTEDERKEVTPEVVDNMETVLADFGVHLLTGLMESCDPKPGASKDEDFATLIEYATIFNNGLYVGSVPFGIVVFDAVWIEQVRDFVSCISIPDSFGMKRYQELETNLKCMSYNDLALMQCDIRDSVVHDLVDLAANLNEDDE